MRCRRHGPLKCASGRRALPTATPGAPMNSYGVGTRICGSVLLGEFAVVFRQRFKGGRAHVCISKWLFEENAGQPSPCTGRLAPPVRSIPIGRLNSS